MTNLHDELMAIYHQRKALSPQLVVDAARAEDHPLHGRFTWDDAVAGERFRLMQAADMIRSVRVIYAANQETGEERKVRAFVSTGQPDRPSVYQPTDAAFGDPFTRQLVLRQFERAILALKRQYGHLQEFDTYLRTKGLGDVA